MAKTYLTRPIAQYTATKVRSLNLVVKVVIYKSKVVVRSKPL